MRAVDVLIPTRDRAAALAVTLTGLLGQRFTDFGVVVMDQSDGPPSYDGGEARTIIRLLQARGHPVATLRNLPRRGLAHQRQQLLEQATAARVLFLDDDVILEPEALARMVAALDAARCGFVGSAVIGLSFADDVRPHQQAMEPWPGNIVAPEHIEPGSPAWARHLLHNAANLWHVQRHADMARDGWLLYKIAWVGGCVLYDRAKLLDCGGFSFWRDVPEQHCGEDVLAQLRVMARHGGCGIMPSGAYHQELPTTVPDRDIDLPRWAAAGATAAAASSCGMRGDTGGAAPP